MAAIAILLSCSKPKTTQTRALTTQEQQLLGTWYITKQVDTQQYYINGGLSSDTSKTYYKTYTNFTSANHITFKSTAYKDPGIGIGNLGLQCIDYSYGLSSQAGAASATGTKDSTYWFWDDDLLEIVINGIDYYIISVSANSLVLQYNTPYIAGLTKYDNNWCYLKK